MEKAVLLTKYVVGAKANPPKKPRRPPKKGKQMAINIVKAESRQTVLVSTSNLYIKQQI